MKYLVVGSMGYKVGVFDTFDAAYRRRFRSRLKQAFRVLLKKGEW